MTRTFIAPYLRLGSLAACTVLSLSAFGGEPPQEVSKEVQVTRNQKRFVGYDLTSIPRDTPVKLSLKVVDADGGADFVDKSGKLSNAGGDVSWTIETNDLHTFKANSAPFQRDRTKYVVFARGEWQTGGGTGGKAPIWEVSVVHPLINVVGASYPANKKLLATASRHLKAELITPQGNKPKGTWTWSYPGGGAFAPVDNPSTTYTAPTDLTAAAQKDKVNVRIEFKIEDSGDVTADDFPLNITAPKKFTAEKEGNIYSKVFGPFVSNNNRTTPLIDAVATYFMFDQFGDSITQSDKGNKHVQIKEDLPWTGYSKAADWAKKEVSRTTKDWENRDTDSFTDNMQIGITGPEFPIRLLTVKEAGGKGPDRGRLVPELRSNGAVVLQLRFHTWHATVTGNAALDTEITENVFSVVIDSYSNNGNVDSYKLKSTYEVKIRDAVKK